MNKINNSMKNTNNNINANNTSKNFQKTFSNPIKPIIKDNVQFNRDSSNMKFESFFSKTQSILDNLASLSIFDKESLQKGMKIDFVKTNDSVFFKIYVGAELYLACAYTYIFDERLFAKEESPKIHFTQCETIKSIPKEFIKICVPTKNAFDYRVRSNGIDTRLFYEHPLRICPLCISILCKILTKKHSKEIVPNQIKEQEIMGLLFKNKLKNIVY